jgi:hypothetical protein
MSLNFYRDRAANTPVELFFIEILRHDGIPSFQNPTPDPDLAEDDDTKQALLEGRQAYDVGIGFPEDVWQLTDVKVDWETQRTGNIFVEYNALLHTRSQTFVYFILRPDGIYISCLPVQKLWEAYHLKDELPRGDGTFYEQYRYKHVHGGDQADNQGILLPTSVALKIEQPYHLWKKQFQNINQRAA